MVLVVMAGALESGVAQQPPPTQPAGTDEPCPLATLRGAFLYEEPIHWRTVQDWLGHATAVAKVVIADIRPGRFDATASGAPPTPDPDPDEDYFAPTITEPVVLDAVHVYSGTAVSGYVVGRAGETSPDCPGYVYETSPECREGEVGDMVMLFAHSIWPEDEELYRGGDIFWPGHLYSIRDELNRLPGKHYEAVGVVTWFLYHEGYAWSCNFLHPMPIAELEAEVEALTGG